MVGFIGLGVMGARMARHLADAGHDVTVWNRTPEKAAALADVARVAASPSELAESCDAVFLCVSRTEDVREVIEAMQPARDQLLVDHSTIEPSAARAIAASYPLFLDAPVTGGEKGAVEGTLTIFCGGSEEAFEMARPYMQAYGKAVRRVGDSGAGQMMKMANQVSVAICVLAMAECLALAEKAGLDMQDAISLIGSGAGASWSLANYGPKVLDRDWSPGFAIDLQQKDLGYALAAARELGVDLPGTEMVHRLFAKLQEQGRGGEATPALFTLYGD